MRNIIVLVVSVMILTGCYTEKKAFRQLDRAYNTYPATTAIRCDTWFPIKWYDSTSLEYVPGEVQYRYDSVEFNLDSLLSELSRYSSIADSFESPAPDPVKPTVIKIPCPPCPERVDTVKSVTNKQGENTAAIEVERLKTESAKEEVNKLRERIAVMRVYLLITGLFTVYSVIRWVIRIWGFKLP